MTDTSKLTLAREKVDLAVELHQELLSLPSFTKVHLSPSSKDETILEITTSHRSLSQLTKTNAVQTLNLSSSNTITSTSSLHFTSSEVLHTSYSPDGIHSALFKSVVGHGNDKESGSQKRLIEIWDVISGQKEAELEVTKVHGDWYFDDNFGIPSWSQDGRSLAYTAEAASPKYTSLDSRKFQYTPNFGEKFSSSRFPSLFLFLLPSSPFSLDLKTQSPTLHQLTNRESFPNISFGQAVFLPSSNKNIPRVICTGYSAIKDGRKLGIVYCTNRNTAIYELSFSQSRSANGSALSDSEEVETKKKSKLSDKGQTSWECRTSTLRSPIGRSARSPRVLISAFEPILIFISNPSEGPHNSCASLHAVSIRRGNTVVLVDTVLTPNLNEDFPGLYLDQLPVSPFLLLPEGPHVVFSSSWRSRKVPLLVSLKTGEVKNLLPWASKSETDLVLPYLEASPESLESLVVLGTDGRDRIVGVKSSCTRPGELVVGSIKEDEEIDWKVVKKHNLSDNASQALSLLDSTILPLPKFGFSEIILISPIKIDPSAETRLDLPPLITIPHGGPHSVFSTEFSASTVALSLAGYRVALVNYPGSIGFGQTFVEILPPNLGNIDVDATLAVPHFLNTISLASRTKGKKLLMGGSHGGYISSHLTARFPEEFDAVVMRNPVTDLATMASSTDIPDWVFAEAGLDYPFSSPPTSITPETFNHLHSISPLSFVKGVITPTLLLIGSNDRRVPPDQGRNWYHALKNQKVETEMLVFRGNGHALDSDVETEILSFESGLRWLVRFTKF